MGNLPRGATQRAAAGVIPGNDQLDNAAMTDSMNAFNAGKGWNSVRTILEGLILAGILWMAQSMQQQATAMAKLQVQVDQLMVSVAGFPDLSTRVTRLEVVTSDLEHRTDLNDKYRQQQHP